MSPTSELHDILQRGRSSLGLHVGIISHIDGDTYTIVDVLSDYPGFYTGDCFELGNTYCLDVSRRQEVMTYADVAKIHEMLKHPVYLSTQLRAYIGAPIMLDSCFWGTLNFSSKQPKSNFADDDFRLMDTLSKEIATVIKNHGIA